MSVVENLEKLKEPFPANEVSWRIGKKAKSGNKGMALAYIDARAVMDRLDEVVGPENWQRKHSFGTNGEVLCAIGIRIVNKWIWKGDGAGQTNFEAEKGGLSDAFKRAGVSWGIGRYLYNLDSPWVPIDQYGNIQQVPQLPGWALPGGNKKPAQQDLEKGFDKWDEQHCQECGKEVDDRVKSYSNNKYGRTLCRDCQT